MVYINRSRKSIKDRKKYISKYKSSRRRKYIKRGGSSNNNKQPVKKLVSAEAYKDMCKYNTYDIYKVNLFDNKMLEDGDTIFIHTQHIPKFLETPPAIGKKLTFVIAGSDLTFDDNLMSSLQPYSINVYAANCSTKNAKQIPLGFRDNIWTPNQDLEDIMNDSSKSSDKTILCLVNFLIQPGNNERVIAKDYFNDKVWATKSDEYMNYGVDKSLNFKNPETIQKRLDFYATLKQTKFTICPVGVGIDTHRVYETLYFGAIPIIKTSFLDPMYIKIGGCWIIKDWSEVTEEECNKRWDNKTTPPLNRNLLYNVRDWIV